MMCLGGLISLENPVFGVDKYWVLFRLIFDDSLGKEID